MIVVLDSGPLGLVTNPLKSQMSLACANWADRLTQLGVMVCVPEICDFEIRRDALQRNSARNIDLLNRMQHTYVYIAITTETMRRAAQLWADARNRGQPTADNKALDADVILAAQAQLLAEATGDRVIVATDNIRHLAQFVEARSWQEIDG